MLKLLRKYRQILLVVAGVMLMVAFLLPQAIHELANQRANMTVMKIGHHKISAVQHQEKVMEYEVLNRFAGGMIGAMGIPEGPDQWILLSELAERGGYVGAASGQDMLDEIGKARGYLRLRMQYGEQLLNSLSSNPQFAGFLQGQVQQDVDATHAAYPRVAADTRMTDKQIETTLAKYKGVQRLIRAYSTAARVSNPRAIIRAEHDLEGAQIEYIFISSDRQLPNVPTPDDAALQAFMEKYKDVKPGEGEFGIGYLLPARVKLEYLTLDATKIGDKVVPDLKELLRRYNARTDKEQSFDDARPQLEQQVRKETVDKVIAAAQAKIHARVAAVTSKLLDDGQFKALPDDWAGKRPSLASMPDEIVKYVEEKTGVKIDPPEVVVKDSSYLTGEELAALPGIGKSSLDRGQRRVPFADYALSVRELQPSTQVSLQVGIPCDEPTHDSAGSTYYFTVLDTRPESTPKSIDEVREKIEHDWKQVQAYNLLIEQDKQALLQKAIAAGLDSLDDTPKPTPEPGKPAPPSPIKTAKVTLGVLSNGDQSVNTDTFRTAVMEAANKLDPLTSADNYTPEQRMVAVALPQKLGLAVVRIRSLVPLTIEDYRGRQNGIVQQFQADEFRNLKANPFSLDRLKTRMNVEYMKDDSAKQKAAANAGG